VPVLLLLVMGILDYGRFFFDSVSLRQGAREAARQAVVLSYAASCPSGAGITVGARIACSAKAASDITLGTPVVYIPAIKPATTPNWAQGKQLLVCMQSYEQGTGLVPFPANQLIKTKTYMSIEVDSTAVDPEYNTTSANRDPAQTSATSDWSWCT